MSLPIYLDYAATTPVDTRVAELMSKCLTLDGNFGNAASRSHIYGWRAEEAIEDARGHIANLIQCDPREIVWTSGATEANNLALKGAVDAVVSRGRAPEQCHIVTSSIEHKAVLDTCAALAARGVEITYLTPNQLGEITVQQVKDALRDETLIVSLMMVNNELGVVSPIEEIGAICRSKGVLFHVDAAQGGGKEVIDVAAMNVDLMSLSAHKMYGPKGIGGLFVRRTDAFRIEAQIHGGGHERRMRSGTLPTHQIVGFGEAARIACDEMGQEQQRIRLLRERFWAGLQSLEGVAQNGASTKRSAGIINVQFAGVEGESLIMALRELAISSGSACTSASMEPSYVLRQIGVSSQLAHASLRFSFGRFTREDEIDRAVETICATVIAMRSSEQAV